MEAYAAALRSGAPIELLAALVRSAESEMASCKKAEEVELEAYIASIMRAGGDWAEVVAETARLAAAAHEAIVERWRPSRTLHPMFVSICAPGGSTTLVYAGVRLALIGLLRNLGYADARVTLAGQEVALDRLVGDLQLGPDSVLEVHVAAPYLRALTGALPPNPRS